MTAEDAAYAERHWAFFAAALQQAVDLKLLDQDGYEVILPDDAAPGPIPQLAIVEKGLVELVERGMLP